MGIPPRRRRWLICGLLCAVFGAHARLQSPAFNKQLLVAAAKGNVAAVADLLAKGADVNADNGHGVTPLWYAADQANVALVTLLLDHGADPNAKDLEYGKSPLRVASVPWSDVKAPEARAQIVKLMMEKGAGAEGDALVDLIRGGHYDAVRAIVARGDVAASYLNQALGAARRAQQMDLVDLLVKAGAKDAGPVDSARSPERLRLLIGAYRSQSGRELRLSQSIYEDQLLLQRPGRDNVLLLPADLTILRSFDLKTVVTLKPSPLPPSEVTLHDGGRPEPFTRTADAGTEARTVRSERTPSPVGFGDASRSASTTSSAATTTIRLRQGYGGTKEWATFRGPGGSGVADGAAPPTVWDAEKGTNIKWKTPIPGFAHSSPVIWGDRVFVTTVIPKDKPFFRLGGGDEGGASAYTRDDFPHSWRVYALDKQTGQILWERVAYEGIPKTARHVMASQANSTPASDGRHLVVFFGSEGLYCYDLNGKLLWKRDLGALPSGRYLDPSYEWNTATSPIIYKNLVILQLDIVDAPSLTALDIKTGKDVWRTKRDEQPSWPTPLLYEGPSRTELITAAALYARGYDPDTGKELWRLGRHSALPTPSPVAGKGLVFITSGGGTTVQPIYAIRPGGNGDITPKEGEDSGEHVAWSKHRGGSYIPTPIVYGDFLYLCSSNGILTVYDAETGERVYQERLTRGGGYSASPVAADGKVYFASEDGDVIVVRAGPTFERLAVNQMGEIIMATPAIAPGLMIVRTQHHVFGLAEGAPR